MADVPKPTMKNIRFETETGRAMTTFRPATILKIRNHCVIDFISHGSLHNITDINETAFAKHILNVNGTFGWQILHPLLNTKKADS